MIYLIYGLNNYFIDKEINKIIDKHKDYDVVKYDMTLDNISDALEDARTVSLFSTDKIVICKNSVFLTGSKCDIDHNIDDLLKYLKEENSNILIISVIDDIDKRKKITKELLKYNVITCDLLKENELGSFIREYCKNNKYSISDDAVKLIINRLVNDLYIITSELDKLFIYCDKSISYDDVYKCTSIMIKTDIFDLINAIVKKDIDLSLQFYDDLLQTNEEEIKIIVSLANQFRLIYQVKTMKNMGYSENLIATDLKVHPYRVKLANETNITTKECLVYLEKLSLLENSIKLGKMDKKMGFLNFILSI